MEALLYEGEEMKTATQKALEQFSTDGLHRVRMALLGSDVPVLLNGQVVNLSFEDGPSTYG